MVDTTVPVIAVASPGRGGAALAPVLERLAEREAFVLRVGGERALVAVDARDGRRADGSGVSAALPLATDDLPEHLLPILEIMPLQRLALRLAQDRGINPDRPRGLAKITQTR
jgi:glucosamine--fructose-6-phosphate aminotransferase (isomerizing)